MPYIESVHRSFIDDGYSPQDAGELNYVISTRVDEYLRRKGLNYSNINEVIGVLECAKQELYRRVAAPYEDEKMEENGDVYTVAPEEG